MLMRRVVFFCGLGLVSATSLLMPAAAASAGTTSLPGLLDTDGGTIATYKADFPVRPKQIIFEANSVMKVRWTTWTATFARGVGRLYSHGQTLGGAVTVVAEHKSSFEDNNRPPFNFIELQLAYKASGHRVRTTFWNAIDGAGLISWQPRQEILAPGSGTNFFLQ